MNNIYVDEFPKSCRSCSFQCYGSCLGGSDILNGDPYTDICHLKRQKPTDCPLKPLTNRLAEERKRVVQEIKDKISDGLYRNSYGETFIDGDIYEILDQIERGE